MSDHSGRNGFTLGLAVGIFSTVLILLAAAFMGAPDNLSDGEANQNEKYEASPSDNRWWLIPRVLVVEDTLAQWVMAGFTIIAAYLLWRTFRATQSMATETTRIGEAQVRAYLTIKGAVLKLLDGPPPIGGKHWILMVTLQNSGQSPARGFRFSASQGGRKLTDDRPSIDIAGYTTEEVFAHLPSEEWWFETNSTLNLPVCAIRIDYTYVDVFGGKVEGWAGYFAIPLEGVETPLIDITHQVQNQTD